MGTTHIFLISKAYLGWRRWRGGRWGLAARDLKSWELRFLVARVAEFISQLKYCKRIYV